MEPSEKHERAIETLQRNHTDHSRMITGLTNDQANLAARVSQLEDAKRAREIQEAREDERDKATARWRDTMEADLKTVKADMIEMKNFAYKFGWRVLAFVGGPIVLAILAWIFKGGLAG